MIIEKLKAKREFSVFEIIIIILCAPIFISLLISCVSVIISVYASIWAGIVSLWASFVALAVSVPYCLVVGIIHIVNGNAVSGLALFGLCVLILGLLVTFFYATKFLTGLILLLTKKIANYLKNLFIKKEAQ